MCVRFLMDLRGRRLHLRLEDRACIASMSRLCVRAQTLARALLTLLPRAVGPLCCLLLPLGAAVAYALTFSLLLSIILPSFFMLLLVSTCELASAAAPYR